MVSGGQELRTKFPNLYRQLLTGNHDSHVTEIIKTDLPRTFPDNIFFNHTDLHQRQLYNILLAFAHQNQEVGYCQVRPSYNVLIKNIFIVNYLLF